MGEWDGVYCIFGDFRVCKGVWDGHTAEGISVESLWRISWQLNRGADLPRTGGGTDTFVQAIVGSDRKEGSAEMKHMRRTLGKERTRNIPKKICSLFISAAASPLFCSKKF